MSLFAEDRTTLTVSQLNQMVKELLESNLPPIWVEGEISNFARPASGHMYFSLKDEHCQVRTVMFRNRNMLLDFKPENGSHVMAKVRIGFYEARGEFQLIVERMEEVGDGRLQQQFERLKQKLASEGLFDEHLKQELPELPERIGIITSATGAAVRDVLSVLQRRFPSIPVAIYPVPVQGDGAAEQIARTIRKASTQQYCDVLLLVRGGGSLEDLWSFNEEIVARAIYDCKIPLVCGVGHETDFTIADFVADVRAPTPSAAAELVTPDQYSYIQSFDYYAERLTQLLYYKTEQLSQKMQWLRQRLQQQHPRNRLRLVKTQRQQLSRQLAQHMLRQLQNSSTTLKYTVLQLQRHNPEARLVSSKAQLERLLERLQRSMQQKIATKNQTLALNARSLNAYNPLQTLSRGYSITTRNDTGEAVLSSHQLRLGEKINTRFDHGSVVSEITELNEPD